MKHIKTQMLFYTSMAIFLSCLFINLVSSATFTKLYTREVYRSCESQALQILQGVDQKVQAVEDSVSLIFTEQSTISYLTQTDFNHPDGLVYKAYQRVDWVLRSFRQQFPQFVGMLFYNGKESVYKYNYYNPSLAALQDFLKPETVQGSIQTDQFHWKGVYPVNNQIAKENAYIVTRNFVDYQNLNQLGVIVILLEEDVFSAIYRPIKETSGAQVYLFNEMDQPVEAYDQASMENLRRNLEGIQVGQGDVAQVKADDNGSLFTLCTSTVTGWTICVEIPMDVLTNSMRHLIIVNTIVSILIVILFGLFLFQYISRITNDIVCVANAMQVVEENNFSLRLHSDRRDEIGLIYAGFNTMAENLGKYFQRAMQEEKSKNEAEIRAMFHQIKPHFLYNTLASIRMTAMKQGCVEVVDMLGTLNRLLRNTINVRNHFISLEEELNNLRDYIKICSVRYNHQIQFSIQVPHELLRCEVPNMIIQPLVENAIEHGLSETVGEACRSACIEIRAFRQGEELWIQVYDNGTGMTDMELSAVMQESSTAEREGHIGIHNIHSRLKILYGESCGVWIESEKNQYTCVTLKLKMRGVMGQEAGGETDC